MRNMLAVVLVGLLVASAHGFPDDVKTDRKKLQGTWQLVAEVVDGKKAPPEYVKQIKLTFDAEGNWRVEKGGKLLFRGTYKIDPAKSPKEITSTLTAPEANKGAVVRSIYKIEGDTYTQCWAVERPRPKDFKANTTAGDNLSTYKRVKK